MKMFWTLSYIIILVILLVKKGRIFQKSMITVHLSVSKFLMIVTVCYWSILILFNRHFIFIEQCRSKWSQFYLHLIVSWWLYTFNSNTFRKNPPSSKEKQVEIWSFIQIGIQWKFHIYYFITWPLYHSLPLPYVFYLASKLCGFWLFWIPEIWTYNTILTIWPS